MNLANWGNPNMVMDGGRKVLISAEALILFAASLIYLGITPAGLGLGLIFLVMLLLWHRKWLLAKD